MPLKLVRKLFVKCSCCGEFTGLNPADSSEWSSYEERPMGGSMDYEYLYEAECGECGNRLSVSVRCSEYPVGSVEHLSYEACGCTFVNDPTVELDVYSFGPPDVGEVATAMSDIDAFRHRLVRSAVGSATPREFEFLVSELWRSLGYETEVTAATRDGGKDVVARRRVGGRDLVLYIECKHYSPGNKVAVRYVRELYGVKERDSADAAILVTTSDFTRNARD